MTAPTQGGREPFWREPDDDTSANWLPVAASSPFYLMMRLYLPKPEVIDRHWLPPAIERFDGD